MENLLFQLLPQTPRSTWVRYGITLAVTGAATLLRYSLEPVLKGYPFLLYIPGIFLVSLLFDRASGFLAVILSGLLTAWLFIEPRGSLWIANQGEQLAFMIYMALGFGIAAVTEALRKTLNKLQQALDKVAASDREKDLMLSEVHHRIRNDLQLISIQLSLAADRPERMQSILSGTVERIGVLARVYGRLRRVESMSLVNAREFLESLVQDLQLGMVGVRPIALGASAEDVELDMGAAIAVGTIANELVTNAVKYAFPGNQAGRVDLTFAREGEDYVLTVSDDGAGITSDQPKGTGLGRQITQQLAQQLHGTLAVRPRPGGGVDAVLRFPAPKSGGPVRAS
ncbi:DUF4118 domain-containing protein [Azospirillum sp. SYSU D00513]|uniref:sensor histidine kinase n=1 Tax=Azospirillum sp. SYSU D00513 TaxID=2812561 RepID=UPI001A96104F|nr:DUF4118 domain-containing protein [Azospirillum sp. SYSU D00513]